MICSILLTNGFLLKVVYVKAIFSYVWVMELPPFYGKGYQLCLLPGLFVEVQLYLSAFPVDVENLM